MYSRLVGTQASRICLGCKLVAIIDVRSTLTIMRRFLGHSAVAKSKIQTLSFAGTVRITVLSLNIQQVYQIKNGLIQVESLRYHNNLR